MIIGACIIGDEGYDGCFLCKLEHCDFGEDVILTGDSGKIEKFETEMALGLRIAALK